jgi:sugar phosphate isomerase/epimerase
MTLAELLAACESSGLLGVELRTQHNHAVEPELSAAERAEVRRRFSDSPVKLVGYGANCEYHSSKPEQVKSNIQQTKRYIELMHDCGGSGVKVKPNSLPKDVDPKKTVQQIGMALNEVARYGQEFGQQIRLEVHGSGTSQLPIVRDIMAVADHPNVAVCWNCNDQDMEGAGLEDNFNMVRDRFGETLHVRELFVKDYPYDQLFKLLLRSAYKGWVLLEARTNPADKVAAMTEQRKLFEQLSQSPGS